MENETETKENMQTPKMTDVRFEEMMLRLFEREENARSTLDAIGKMPGMEPYLPTVEGALKSELRRIAEEMTQLCKREGRDMPTDWDDLVRRVCVAWIEADRDAIDDEFPRD